MAFLYGSAGRLTAHNGVFWSGQALDTLGAQAYGARQHLQVGAALYMLCREPLMKYTGRRDYDGNFHATGTQVGVLCQRALLMCTLVALPVCRV
jgi:hypothetical protein